MSAPRIAAIDRLRGLVMVLMASDHAAHFYYHDHVILDTAMFPRWNQPLPAIPFVHRWLSHLCAPTFVFLAGASIALAAARRGADEQRAFDRDLLLRGLLLLLLEVVFISPLWAPQLEAALMMQVLFALGVGMILMTVLRRLPTAICALLGIGLAVGSEALAAMPRSVLTSWFVTGQMRSDVAVVYPVLPWLSAMLLGHAYGRHLAGKGRAIRPLLCGGAIALAVWVVVKLADGYGNMGMKGIHDSPLRWLQVSKYPPSLAYLGLELGLGAVLLAAFFAWDRRKSATHDRNAPLLVLGQTALFFYVLHIALIEASGRLLMSSGYEPSEDPGSGLARNWAVVAIVVVLGVVFGRAFRDFRARHATSLLRLI